MWKQQTTWVKKISSIVKNHPHWEHHTAGHTQNARKHNCLDQSIGRKHERLTHTLKCKKFAAANSPAEKNVFWLICVVMAHLEEHGDKLFVVDVPVPIDVCLQDELLDEGARSLFQLNFTFLNMNLNLICLIWIVI